MTDLERWLKKNYIGRIVTFGILSKMAMAVGVYNRSSASLPMSSLNGIPACQRTVKQVSMINELLKERNDLGPLSTR